MQTWEPPLRLLLAWACSIIIPSASWLSWPETGPASHMHHTVTLSLSHTHTHTHTHTHASTAPVRGSQDSPRLRPASAQSLRVSVHQLRRPSSQRPTPSRHVPHPRHTAHCRPAQPTRPRHAGHQPEVQLWEPIGPHHRNLAVTANLVRLWYYVSYTCTWPARDSAVPRLLSTAIVLQSVVGWWLQGEEYDNNADNTNTNTNKSCHSCRSYPL